MFRSCDLGFRAELSWGRFETCPSCHFNVGTLYAARYDNHWMDDHNDWGRQMSAWWKPGRAALLAAFGIGIGLIAKEALQRQREANLSGQVVLITGGSRGLGFLLAREFLREGCAVAVCARDAQELALARQDLEKVGGEVLAVPCDVADRTQVEETLREVMRRFGRVDILVNNAGIMSVGPVQTMTASDFESALGVMFWGILYPTLAVLPQMLERGSGRIVNITSIGGKVIAPHLLPYISAKYAAVGLSEGLHAELAKDNIAVTTVVPGLMRTGSFMNAYFKGDQRREFAWFSVGSSLPFISMDAERAARQIVSATKRGESEVILSLPANAIARLHGLFPGAISRAMALANRFLPPADGAGTSAARGTEIHRGMKSRLLDLLIGLGLSAARRFHEYPGPTAVMPPGTQSESDKAA